MRTMDKESNILRLNETTTNIKSEIESINKTIEERHDQLLESMVKEKKHFIEITSKIQDIDTSFTNKTNLLETRIKVIEGPKDFETKDDPEQKFIPDFNSAKSIKEIIKSINITNRIYHESFEKMQLKIESQANEVFSRIRKQLGSN